METTKPHGFCVTPGSQCSMNYCDENGCVDAKKNIGELPRKELINPNREEIEVDGGHQSRPYSLEITPEASGEKDRFFYSWDDDGWHTVYDRNGEGGKTKVWGLWEGTPGDRNEFFARQTTIALNSYETKLKLSPQSKEASGENDGTNVIQILQELNAARMKNVPSLIINGEEWVRAKDIRQSKEDAETLREISKYLEGQGFVGSVNDIRAIADRLQQGKHKGIKP